ncbi:MAG: TetR family transcriptional regulator [Microcella sp.]|uniref:TetR/AcrR family transcriptional regulator n=1 Tax=Microcella sp. TaxID=1913979 RepID=UPI003314BEFD
MRSAGDDLTTRARIRDAALALFGAHGFDGTSVRAIAARAGVSAALVIHHYGSKDALRTACDTAIVDEIMGRKKSMLAEGDLATTMQRWLTDLVTFRPSLDYLARMIIDGGDAGQALFDQLVDRTEAMISQGVEDGVMKAPSDLRTTAVIVATHGLMPLVLERHIGRALGGLGLSGPGLSLDVVRRLTLPTLELYTHGLYADDSALSAARAALQERTPGP